MDPLDERDTIVTTRHPGRVRWLLALGALVLAAVVVWLMPENGIEPETGAVGTSGSHDDAAATSGSHDEAVGEDAAVLREIETITGVNDAMSLVGRRVDLHVDVQRLANDHAFWVGSPDNRVLVVLGRDNRTGTTRQAGMTASHGISPVREGQRAAISGVVRPIPIAEERFSWDLTAQDQRDLDDRKVYIRADIVRPEGHGTP